MKRALLLMVVPALLVALGFAQTPATSVNTDPTSIKGCLAGSDGNYTVVQDNTGHVLKIATSSVDLKPHVGHDVTLIGHKASGESPAAADNGFAVTEVNMISEHCAAAAAAPTATVVTPAETATTPDAAAAAPAATAVAPAATTSSVTQTEVTPPADATAPAATVAPPAETPIAPPAAVTPPAETAVAPAETVSTPWDKPAADAPVAARRPAHSRRPSPTPAPAAVTPVVTASTSSKAVSTPDATAATPAATATTPAATASAPDVAVAPPVAPSKRGSLLLLIALGVVVIVIGTLVPVLSRWRKRKNLERTDAPNLSFTRETSSDQAKSDPKNPRKAA